MEIVMEVFVFVLAGIMAVISIRSFRNHGFLLNNEYIFASLHTTAEEVSGYQCFQDQWRN